MVVNGLNASSTVVAPISRYFENNGLDVEYVPLPGQRDDAIEWGDANDWAAPVAQKFAQLSTVYKQVHILGYSIGGVATLLAVTQLQDRSKLGKVILVAPPLALRANIGLIRVITPLRLVGLSLPSVSPHELRIHNSVPLAVYHTALKLIDEAGIIPSSDLKSLSVVCFLTPHDEIVSAGKTRRWIEDRKLPWTVVETTPLEPTTYNHLFVHPCAHSADGWKNFRESVLRNLTVVASHQTAAHSP